MVLMLVMLMLMMLLLMFMFPNSPIWARLIASRA
jgi:hypothetical protein